jgi:hypothetical protein
MVKVVKRAGKELQARDLKGQAKEIYLRLNGLFEVDKGVIQREIKEGIKRAEGWHRKNTGELKIISLDKSCRPPKVPSHKLKIKINELLKDPEKKQAATAYIASRGALNSFATASVSINASKDGVMSKAALRETFLGFQYLGTADYLCKANYLMDDSLLIKEQGRIQAESKRKSDNSKGGKNKKGKLKTYFGSILPNYAGSHIDDVLRVIYMAVQGYAKENNLKPLSVTVITKKSDFTRGMKLLKDKWIKNAPNNQIIYGEKTPSTSRLKIKK